MGTKEWFELAARIIGIVVLIYGVTDLINSLLFYYRYFVFPDSTTGYYLILGLSYVFMGLYLMRGASHLVTFAFPEEDDYKSDGEEENGDPQNNH